MWTFPAGQIRGIPIRLHVSWIILLLLGVATLQPVFAERTQTTGWPLALLTTLLVLTSIVLHEVGHAIVAQRYNLHVESITLFLTGGYTEIREQLEQPGTEFKIALAGPLVSAAIALGTALAAWLSVGATQLSFGIVAAVNGLLLGFNLLPCYPLDGGRALRAVFWFLHQDLLKGTALATHVARLLGGALMLLGVIVLVTGDVFSGFATMLLGWMATRAALGSYLQTALYYTLSRISVRELMSGTFRTVSPQMTLDLFVGQYLLGQSEQGFPVVQAEQVIGLITVRNLRHYTPQQWQQTSVRDVMIPFRELPQIRPDDSAQIAYVALAGKRFDQLPVIENGELMGMIRYRDVINVVQQTMRRSQPEKK